MPKLGERVADNKNVKIHKGPPPLVLAVQPDSYIRMENSEELRQWESDLRNSVGISIRDSGLTGSASESCSGGCSDDCDVC